MQVLLETKSLTLRRFTSTDVDNLVELDSDPEVMRFLSGGKPTPRELIETEILPRFLTYDDRFPGRGSYAAIERATGDFVGWFGLRARKDRATDELELGFRLRRAAWGKGYATEGTRALVEVAFGRLHASRVMAITYESNHASQRVLEKAGLVLVRSFRMTADDLAAVGTYETSSDEPWIGDDLEYALERNAWGRLRREADQ